MFQKSNIAVVYCISVLCWNTFIRTYKNSCQYGPCQLVSRYRWFGEAYCLLRPGIPTSISSSPWGQKILYKKSNLVVKIWFYLYMHTVWNTSSALVHCVRKVTAHLRFCSNVRVGETVTSWARQNCSYQLRVQDCTSHLPTKKKTPYLPDWMCLMKFGTQEKWGSDSRKFPNTAGTHRTALRSTNGEQVSWNGIHGWCSAYGRQSGRNGGQNASQSL